MPGGPGTDSACTLIAGFEGFREEAYPDPKSPRGEHLAKTGRDDPGLDGKPWTVGYGFTGKLPGGVVIGPGVKITRSEADAELTRRVGHDRHVLEAMVTVPLKEHQWDALGSLVYNIGLEDFETSTLRRLLNDGNYVAAADQFPRWNHSRGVVVPALTNRRIAERALFLKA